jgi:hypothetical protein
MDTDVATESQRTQREDMTVEAESPGKKAARTGVRESIALPQMNNIRDGARYAR